MEGSARNEQTGGDAHVTSGGRPRLITEGPFAGRVGAVTRIDAESATVVVDVFDRARPVDLGLGDVEPPPS